MHTHPTRAHLILFQIHLPYAHQKCPLEATALLEKCWIRAATFSPLTSSNFIEYVQQTALIINLFFSLCQTNLPLYWIVYYIKSNCCKITLFYLACYWIYIVSTNTNYAGRSKDLGLCRYLVSFIFLKAQFSVFKLFLQLHSHIYTKSKRIRRLQNFCRIPCKLYPHWENHVRYSRSLVINHFGIRTSTVEMAEIPPLIALFLKLDSPQLLSVASLLNTLFDILHC